MKKIAFKNFRRFQEFPEIELGNISIMVGRNNSGKSTMVKAILLVLDYLQNQQYNEFSFTNKSLEDANIVTFGRAKNNKLESNEIVFEFETYSFSIFIYGGNEDTSASVSKLIIKDPNLSTTFEINYNEESITITKSNPKITTKFDALGEMIDAMTKLEEEKNKPDFKQTSIEGLRLLDRYNSLVEKMDVLNKNLIKEFDNSQNNELFKISYPLKLNLENKTEDTILQEFVSDFVFQNDAEVRKYKSYLDDIAKEKQIIEIATDKTEIEVSNKRLDDINKKIVLLNLEEKTLDEKIQELVDIDNYKSDLTRSIDNAIKSIKDFQVYYLGANSSKQTALFSIRDKQNNLAQAIHNFKQSKIESHHQEYIFVKKWMKEFEIGELFAILLQAGEAYEFYIIDKDGKEEHLSDKGMGSIQAMTLILKIATIMRMHKNTLKYVTIIVEEPELNLHPEFQGKLTEFFHNVNKEHQISFIIETHSEYLIRRTQSFVAENQYTNQDGLNPNPFKVHYFDVNKGPYEMNYRNDGRFTNEFGTGFFDVNSNLIFDLP